MNALRTTFAANGTRTSRTSLPRRLAGGVAAAVVALALTACQDGSGIQDEGAAAAPESVTSMPSTGDTGTAGTAGSTEGATPGRQGTSVTPASTSSKKTGGTTAGAATAGSGPAATKVPPAARKRVLCNGANTAVTVQPLSRPLNHMLITVKNTGSKVCDLTYYPVLRFDEMQWAPSPREETKPQAVVSLAPGQSGYAAAMLSAADGSGEGGTTGRRLTIAFQGMTPHSSGGASATPSLPAKGLHYDSALTVTYWQQELSDALDQ